MPPKARWRIVFDKRAEKLFSKLNSSTKSRIAEFLDQKLSINPTAYFKILAGNNKFFRARVGDYRIIFELKNQELIIINIDIGHRQEIYR